MVKLRPHEVAFAEPVTATYSWLECGIFCFPTGEDSTRGPLDVAGPTFFPHYVQCVLSWPSSWTEAWHPASPSKFHI